MTVHHKSQRGVTLIELIFSIVILSVSLIGVMSVFHQTTTNSANPIVEHQAIAIAESYLEEILLKNFCEDDTDTMNCPLIVGKETGETRSTFNDVDDYHGLNDTGVHDQRGNLVTTLSNYNVSVAVSSSDVFVTVSAVSFPESDLKKVTVTVSGMGTSLDLVGYRAEY